MYKKARCTCKVVVLRNKPIAFLTSWMPSPLSLLKLPIVIRVQLRSGWVFCSYSQMFNHLILDSIPWNAMIVCMYRTVYHSIFNFFKT